MFLVIWGEFIYLEIGVFVSDMAFVNENASEI